MGLLLYLEDSSFLPVVESRTTFVETQQQVETESKDDVEYQGAHS